MKLVRTLLAAAAVAVSFGASAQVTGSTFNTPSGSFLTLTGPTSTSVLVTPCTTVTCSLGGIATISGGAEYAGDQPFADIPANGGVTRFLAAGPSSTQGSTVSFSSSTIDYVSFLWGSPDLYNRLTVTSTDGVSMFSQMFTVAATVGATSLGFTTTNGSQSFSQYVQFIAGAGTHITGLVFNNIPSVDAFEAANFSVVRVVPEPETYALMLAGLGALGFISRRRRRV